MVIKLKNIKNIKYRQIGSNKKNYYSHILNNSFEIIQTWSEDGSVMINDRFYSMRRGAVYLIPPNTPHYTNSQTPDLYERNKLMISSESVNTLSELCGSEVFERLFLTPGKSCLLFSESKALEIDALFREIADTSTNNDDFSEYRKLALFLLLIEKLLDSQSATSKPNLNNDIQKAIDFISENLDSSLNLDMICQNVFLTKPYFCNLFKSALGITVSQYITDRRIAMAKDLLSSSDMSVSQVGISCGFANFSYFSRVFKEKCGMTPSEYRKQKSGQQNFLSFEKHTYNQRSDKVR